MKKKANVILFLERIAIVLILGATSFALFFSISGNTDTATRCSLDAVVGGMLIMMLGAMIKNLRAYGKTGMFFETHRPNSSLGVAAYIMSRGTWTMFFICLVFVNHSDSGSAGDTASVSLLGGSMILSLPTLITGIIYFSRRSKERSGKLKASPTFLQYYGRGEGTHLRLPCRSFDLMDDRLSKRLEIASNGLITYLSENGVSPSRTLLQNGLAVDAYPVSAKDLEDLAASTSANYLRAYNELLRKLGYGTVITPEDWRAVILSSADQWVLNRLTSQIDVRYYLISCMDMLLYPRGLTVVELSGFEGEASLTVIVRADKARELEYYTR